jgi:hypothetical protein
MDFVNREGDCVSDFFSDVLVPDMMLLIFGEVLTLAPRFQVWSMSQVSKMWRTTLYTLIDGWFAALRKRCREVDAACKMMYPLRMWELYQEMAAFCLDLGMRPHEVLGYVRPAWFLQEHSGKTLQRLEELGMIHPQHSTRRFYLHKLADILLFPTNQDNLRSILGPFLFEEEGPGWNTYLLALFLGCNRGVHGFQSCAIRAAEHFDTHWNVSLAVNGDSWQIFFQGVYEQKTLVGVLKQALYQRAVNLSPECCDYFISHMSQTLFLGCQTVHQFLRLAMHGEAQAYMFSILPPEDPEEMRTLTWHDLFPDPAILSPNYAAGMYAFVNKVVKVECPDIYTPEIRKGLFNAMGCIK